MGFCVADRLVTMQIYRIIHRRRFAEAVTSFVRDDDLSICPKALHIDGRTFCVAVKM
jgi:hypothetical protein